MDMTFEHEGMPLQRAFQDENVMRVELAAMKDEVMANEILLRGVQTEGLHIGLRSYQFCGETTARDSEIKFNIDFQSYVE